MERVAVTQARVDEYVRGAKVLFPIIEEWQLISMVVLHFDMPDAEAKRMVEVSLEVKRQ